MHETYKKWLDGGKPKVICKCGCGEEITIKEFHKWYGIPKYLPGHNGFIINMGGWNKGIPQTTETKLKISVGVKNSDKHQNAVKNFETAHYGDDNGNWKGGLKYICPKCGGKKSYNSKTCRKCLDFTGKNNPNYNEGKSYGDYCEKWTEKKREEVRNQYGRKCYLCGKSEEQQKADQKLKGKREFRLSVHHIDDDKEQGCNNKPWKLVPLCLQCHIKVKKHKIVSL